MKRVIFKSKSGTEIIEYTSADESSVKLRALALGWFIVSIENTES